MWSVVVEECSWIKEVVTDSSKCFRKILSAVLYIKHAERQQIIMYLVEVTELPEENQQLLMELDLLGGVGQVRLLQRVRQEPSQALQDEVEVLQKERFFKSSTFKSNLVVNGDR